MPTTILTAIATLEQIVLRKNEPVILVKVIIFGLAGKYPLLFSLLRHYSKFVIRNS